MHILARRVCALQSGTLGPCRAEFSSVCFTVLSTRNLRKWAKNTVRIIIRVQQQQQIQDLVKDLSKPRRDALFHGGGVWVSWNHPCTKHRITEHHPTWTGLGDRVDLCE